MNSTKYLLTLGDAQLRHCPPNILPAFTLTFQQHATRVPFRIVSPGAIAVVRDGEGQAQTMSCCILYANCAGECWSHATVFGRS